MTDYEKLKQAVDILRKFNLPISPILEYSINEKLQELSCQVENPSDIQEILTTLTSNVEPVQPYKFLTKLAPTRLRVTRSNGSTIEESKAANTLCLVIKEIGPEIVEKIGLSVDGQNIILRDLGPDRRGDRHDIGNNFFVNTHSSTLAKKIQLERIFKALRLPWKVDII